jgi:hypothetical protein
MAALALYAGAILWVFATRKVTEFEAPAAARDATATVASDATQAAAGQSGST